MPGTGPSLQGEPLLLFADLACCCAELSSLPMCDFVLPTLKLVPECTVEFDLCLQVACESATKTNMVMIFGEITTTAKVDYEKVVRDTVRNIGFTSDDVGIDADKMNVLVHIEEQSPDIGQGVHGMGTKTLEETGSSWQRFACTPTHPRLTCLLRHPACRCCA